MALPDLYSRRKRALVNKPDDFYQYEDLTPKLRTQLIQIFSEALGDYGYQKRCNDWWDDATTIMRKEKGVFALHNRADNSQHEYGNWFLTEPEIDLALDGLELMCRFITNFHNTQHSEPDQFIDEINARLQEAGFGFEFAGGILVKIDNYLLHQEVVKPALLLLSTPPFAPANGEFISAHAQFRAGDYETAVVDCGKAFESVLKTIGTARGWQIKDNDTSSKLVSEAFASGFIPSYMQTQFSGLRSLLDSGTATVRNRMGAHGAGITARQVDKHLAAYQMHQTAAAIVFLVEHHEQLP